MIKFLILLTIVLGAWESTDFLGPHYYPVALLNFVVAGLLIWFDLYDQKTR